MRRLYFFICLFFDRLLVTENVSFAIIFHLVINISVPFQIALLYSSFAEALRLQPTSKRNR